MPNSTVHRWAKEGMPVRRDDGMVVASPEELNQWLQRTSGEAAGVHVVTPGSDLLKDLRAPVAAKGEPRTLCESLTLDGHSTCESTQNQGRAISRPTRVRRALSRCEFQQRGDQTPVAISRYS